MILLKYFYYVWFVIILRNDYCVYCDNIKKIIIVYDKIFSNNKIVRQFDRLTILWVNGVNGLMGL